MKKILLTLLSLPLGLSAVGLGVYVPLSFAERSSVSVSSNFSSTYEPNYTLKTNYKESVGIGLVLDTNVQKDALFNYRLGLEAINREINNGNGSSCLNNCDYGRRYNIVNTFGFALVRNEDVRVWLGPRINIAWNTQSGDKDYFRTEFELGIAPVLGINVDLGKVVSLSFDLDYRISNITGASSNSGSSSYSSFTYSGTTQGATARFYIIFKINDGFYPNSP